MLPGPAVPGRSLVSFHFLWATLCSCPKVVEPSRDCATWRSDVQFLSDILQLSILFMFNILGTACFMKVELSGAAGASSNANNGVGANGGGGGSGGGDNRSESGSQHSEDALLD